MIVLGLCFGHDGSVAVVRDGKLVSAIATERITRVKKNRGVTRETLRYGLKKIYWFDIPKKNIIPFHAPRPEVLRANTDYIRSRQRHHGEIENSR